MVLERIKRVKGIEVEIEIVMDQSDLVGQSQKFLRQGVDVQLKGEGAL